MNNEIFGDGIKNNRKQTSIDKKTTILFLSCNSFVLQQNSKDNNMETTKRAYLIIIFSIICSISSYANLVVKPTFESCSLYLSYSVGGNETVECKVFYKSKTDNDWLPAYEPIYDDTRKEFRGSLVRLQENTAYKVKAELYFNGVMMKDFVEDFKTWDSCPPITKTLNISTFKNKNNNSYTINKISGTSDGYIKIVGDVKVDALSTTQDYAIMVSDSKYVILEGITVIGGNKHGIFVAGTSSDVRIINCDISKWGRMSSMQNINGVYVDPVDNKTKINNDAGIKIDKSQNIVVERCYIHDSKAKTNPWEGVIQEGQYKGKSFSNTHPEGANGIHVNQTLGGIVLRYNDIIGSQTHRYNDPVEASQNGNVNGGFNKDADIYGNVMAFGQDDGIELDGGQCNIRLFNNRFEQTFCGVSTAPNMKGPSYIFNNIIWNLGDSESSEGVAVKNGGGDTHSIGRQFFFNNTMFVTKNGMSGVGYGSSKNRAMFHATTRNNIFISRRKPVVSFLKGGDGLSISDREETNTNDFDYDVIGNTKTEGYKGKVYAVLGSEAHGVYGLPEFENWEKGLFTLKLSDKIALDNGIVIPNFTQKYHGKAPDMGALELYSYSLFPIRPLDIVADRYYIKLKSGKMERITLFVGKMESESRFTIHKSEDMSWLTVSADTDVIKPDTKIELSLSAVKTTGKQIGMMIVRLTNGLSVPITVFVE
jgi:hypothetical protein